MVKYVLHFFKGRARGEVIRLAFKLAGVDYEEVNVEWSDWPRVKQNYVCQHLPVLEVDGKMIEQSKAILRYLAREFGLYGKTSLEAAYIDQAIDMVEDLWVPVNDLYATGTSEEKAAKRKKYSEEIVPPIYTALERFVTMEQAGDFIVGNSITAADLFFFTAVEMVDVISEGADSLANFPKLAALKSRIADNPKIATWLAVRPRPPDE